MKKLYPFFKIGTGIILFVAIAGFNSLQAQVKPVKEMTRQNATVQEAEAPVIIAPAEKAVLTNFPRETKFEWKAVPGAKLYEIEVEINNGKWDMLKNEKVTGLAFRMDLPGDNPYRWRVRAELGNGTFTKWSAREFSYNTSKQGNKTGQNQPPKGNNEMQLKAPELLGPAEGTVFSTTPRKTKLDWSAVEGAVQYEVQVEYKAGNDWKVLRNVKQDGTSFTFDFVGAQPGRWRVCAVHGEKKGPYSKWSSFSYTK